MANTKMKNLLAENMRRFNTKNLPDLNEISAKELAMGLSLTLAGIGGYFGLDYLNHDVQRAFDQHDAVDIVVDHPGLFTGKTVYTIHVDVEQQNPISVDTSSNVITINTTDFGDFGLKKAIKNKLKDIDPELASLSVKNHHFSVRPNNESNY
jgi:hypothetical protein